MLQTTIQTSIECSGIGLHSGRRVSLRLRPAPEDTGIAFCLQSEEGTRLFKPGPESVVHTGLATTLGFGGSTVSTVEHLLAAIRGLEIDNIFIDIEGSELPIMDGSANSFVFLLRDSGIVRQRRARRVLRVKRRAVFEEDGKSVRVSPSDRFSVDYTIDFAHPKIGVQSYAFELTPDVFARDIAKARTFGFVSDVEKLQKMGLALGGSLDNAVVLDDFAVVNPEGLRYEDEFVRHKILDFIGDMALAGLPLQGHFEVRCSGHALNNAFLRMLIDNSDIYLEETPLAEKASGRPQAEESVAAAAAARPAAAAL